MRVVLDTDVLFSALIAKGVLALAPVFVMVVVGCRPSPPSSLAGPLIGRWEWVGSSGGIDGRTEEPEPGQPRSYVEFRDDGTVRFWVGDEVVRNQTYRIEMTPSIYSVDDQPAVYFGDDPQGQIAIVSEDGSMLSLSQNVYDGFSASYRRVALAP